MTEGRAHNPRHAGVYCYGRRGHRSAGSGTSTAVKPGRNGPYHPRRPSRPYHLARSEANQQRLAINAAARGEDRKAGPPTLNAQLRGHAANRRVSPHLGAVTSQDQYELHDDQTKTARALKREHCSARHGNGERRR